MPSLLARKLVARSALALSKEGVHPLLAKVLSARGISSRSDVAGTLGCLIHHSQLKGAAEAARFLVDCIEESTRIVVVADYDCDGATACATAVRGLRAMGASVNYVVPDRYKHGYGLTPSVVDEVLARFPASQVLLTVDNGVASHDGVRRANEHGLQVVVTDHHMPSKDKPLPNAVAVVDHQQPGCVFESKALAGVGVVWYVLWAMQDELRRRGRRIDFKVSTLLPLVALGSVADVVPLDRNNRILIEAGLTMIRSGKSFAGIEALAQAPKFMKLDPADMLTTDIAFGLGPRINAAGRLTTMDLGIDCLLEDDPEKALKMAETLDGINQERKEVEYEIAEAAFEEAEAMVQEGTKTIVVFSPGWHAGVIGIVAGRIKERRYRPTFVLTQAEDGSIKGSGRSIPGFNIKDALDQVHKTVPGLMLKFGGHAMAAGVTIRAGGLADFRAAFEAEAQRLLTDELLNQVIEHDGELSATAITPETSRILDVVPWGQLFPAPSFCNEFEVIAVKVVGAHKDQLNMRVRLAGIDFNAVKYRHSGPMPGFAVKLVYKLSRTKDKYGNEAVKLFVDYMENMVD